VGSNHVLTLSNINADYNLTALTGVTGVTFEYFDGAGIENLMVNGDFLIDQFATLAGTTFSLGGVDVFIDASSGIGFDYGTVTLTGAVQSFAVGGQQFYVDEVCVDATGHLCEEDTDGDGVCDADEIPGCTNAQADNFNAAATDDDGSCTYTTAACPSDLSGDGTIGISDLLMLLSEFGEDCAQ
jgi:hypothetical protein